MSESLRRQVLRGCYSFLVPVARFLIRSGISFTEFQEVARAAFVHVASADYGVRGRQTNASRVAAMTGIARKKVTEIRQAPNDYASDPRASLSPLGDLLQRWYTDQDFVDEKGSPRPLHYSGGPLCFEALARKTIRDLPPNAVRIEALRSGAVVSDACGNLRPVRREVVPAGFTDKLVSSISFNLHGLASTIAFNSNPDRAGPGRIERYVQSRELDAQQRDRLRIHLRGTIQEFSEGIDNLFASESAPNSVRSVGRVAVGIYYHEDKP